MNWNSLKTKAIGWLCRPVNALSLLAAILLCLDHRWSNLTWGGLSLLAGVALIRMLSRRPTAPAAPRPVDCRLNAAPVATELWHAPTPP